MRLSTTSWRDQCSRHSAYAIAALGLLFSATGLAQTNGGDIERLDGVRPALEKWVETRKIFSLEKRNWALEKETLKDRIEILKRDVQLLHNKTMEAKASIAEADAKNLELTAEKTRLSDAVSSLAATIEPLEAKLKQLLPSLPAPLQERVASLSQLLPENSAETKLSLSQRFQNVAGILNSVNKFHREITMLPEIRKLSDGTSAEVTTVYLGISQGYYVSADGRLAGIGLPSAEGFQWTPNDAAGPAIAKMVAILKNDQVASYVQVPVNVGGEGAKR